MQKINIEFVRKQLLQHSDDNNAFLMSKYMKNNFPFYGIKKPKLREISRPILKELKSYPTEELYLLVQELWQENEREMQYLALDILRKILIKREIEIKIIEELIITKSWWDSVDEFSNLTGEYFKNDYNLELLNNWVDSENIWLNRSALLFQLNYKKITNEELLQNFIHRLKHKKEFFIQKAIGWVLRQYSKTNPQWVIKLVEEEAIIGLARREALRLIK